jgi:hypothetical protein
MVGGFRYAGRFEFGFLVGEGSSQTYVDRNLS